MIEYIRRSHYETHLRHQARREIREEGGVVKETSKAELQDCMSKPKNTGLLCEKSNENSILKFDDYLRLEREKMKLNAKEKERQ